MNVWGGFAGNVLVRAEGFALFGASDEERAGGTVCEHVSVLDDVLFSGSGSGIVCRDGAGIQKRRIEVGG